MPDLIRIIDLEVWARIGVSDEERAQPQRLLVSVELRVESFSRASRTDNILATVDYFEVAERIKELAAENTARLLESLIERVSKRLLAEFAIVSLKIEIKKFVIPEAAWVAVAIERSR